MKIYLIIGLIVNILLPIIIEKIAIMVLKDSKTFKEKKYEKFLLKRKQESILMKFLLEILFIFIWPLSIFLIFVYFGIIYYTLMFDTKSFYNGVKRVREILDASFLI